MKTRLTNKTFGVLFLGSWFIVTSLLVSCTVNVKHSTSKTETKKETQEPSKPVAKKAQKPKNSVTAEKINTTTDLVVYRSVVIEKETPKEEVFEKRESPGDKLDTTNRLLAEILKKIEMKVAKGLL